VRRTLVLGVRGYTHHNQCTHSPKHSSSSWLHRLQHQGVTTHWQASRLYSQSARTHRWLLLLLPGPCLINATGSWCHSPKSLRPNQVLPVLLVLPQHCQW
jgi:hypothetical protein